MDLPDGPTGAERLHAAARLSAHRLDAAIGLVSAGIVLATWVPYWVQDARSRPGESFSGLLTAIPDQCSYLMWMEQHRDGVVFPENRMTTEREGPLLPNPVWWLLGTTARLLGSPPVGTYHAARTVFAFVFLLLLWRLCGAVLREPRSAVLAFGLAAAGSGFGWASSLGIPVQTADWVTELWSFPSLLYFPHFAASLALLCGALLLWVRAHETLDRRRAALSGGLLFVLAFVHPYPLVPLGSALGLRLFIARARGVLLPDRARLDLLVLAGAAAGLATMAAQVAWSPAAAGWAARNAMPSPPILDYLSGLGWTGILGLVGIGGVLRTRSFESPRMLLVLWVAAAFAAAYASPILPHERRSVEGASIALAILGAGAVAPLVARLARWKATVLVAFLILASVPTNALLLRTESTAWNPGQVPNDWPRMFAAVSSLPEPRTVFCDARRGMFLAAFARARVFVGHHELTPEFGRKMAAVEAFFDATQTWDGRRTIVQDAGCEFLVLDPADAAAMGPNGPPPATRIAAGSTWAIYRVR